MASYLDFDNMGNWSFASVPAAFVMCMLPHAYALVTAGDKYDVNLPGKTLEKLANDKTFDKVKLEKFRRAKAASANGFETLAFYAAGIIAANVAGVPVGKINKMAFYYLVSRAIFNYIYVFLQGTSKKVAPLRTLVWGAGIAIVFSLYLSAGRAVSA